MSNKRFARREHASTSVTRMAAACADSTQSTALPARPSLHHARQRAFEALCAVMLALSLSMAPVAALADVRTSDTVRQITAEQLGLPPAQLPSIDAEYAFVATSDGEPYFTRNCHEKTKIASVTKIMTALVALDYLDRNVTVEVSTSAATIGESSASLQAGDKLSLENAVKALMICSGNDAAQAIAESLGPVILKEAQEQSQASDSVATADVPSSPYQAFVWAMNRKANELGMVDSKFGNPHGLDTDQHNGDFYSTAYDVYLMSKKAMESELFRSTVSTHETTIPVQRGDQTVDLVLTSTDTMLTSYPGACGIKTGYTEQAGYCFAGAADRDGETLFAIVLHSTSEQQRFTDCETLMDWVYNNTVDYKLINTDQTVEASIDGTTKEVPVVADVANASWIDSTFKATVSDPNQSVEVFALDGNIGQEATFYEVQGDVHEGQKVGTIEFKQHNQTIATADLIAAQDCPGPDFFQGVGVFWDRAWRTITGQPTQAESSLVNTTPLIKEL